MKNSSSNRVDPNFGQENGTSDKSSHLLTVDELANYLQLRPETIRAMARRGELPALKVGRMWRFDPDLIAKWVENGMRKPSITSSGVE